MLNATFKITHGDILFPNAENTFLRKRPSKICLPSILLILSNYVSHRYFLWRAYINYYTECNNVNIMLLA